MHALESILLCTCTPTLPFAPPAAKNTALHHRLPRFNPIGSAGEPRLSSAMSFPLLPVDRHTKHLAYIDLERTPKSSMRIKQCQNELKYSANAFHLRGWGETGSCRSVQREPVCTKLCEKFSGPSKGSSRHLRSQSPRGARL